jgi:hypothetical protein
MAPRKVDETTGEIVEAEIVRPLVTIPTTLPVHLTESVDIRSWAEALINGATYEEPDPEFLSRMMLRQILMSETESDVYADTGVAKLQESIPNVPGGSTGPILINDIYVAKSDQADGFSCYIILTARDLVSDVERKYSTGAGGVQVQILRLLSLGVWPITCQIKRTERKDRGGRYLFKLYPVD